MIRFLIGLLLSLPGASWACGGLFCDSTMPVNQAAERILFAVEGETLHMHVRITYQGPPAAFGWLLPVPRDVETKLSSEQLFTQLDASFAPVFRLTTEFEEGCEPDFAASGAPTAESDSRDGGGGVNVLSRENVGPYDRAILLPDSIDLLREWLDENGYQIPDATDAKLAPYLEVGAAFVAIKLLPGTDSSDIVPLHLSFNSATPTIPIIPTSVAAEPDMGIIVQILGPSRAIPSNYLHVQINETAIDWFGQGSNYADVVSQAADEAGGQAFTTDFAGPHEGRVNLPPVSDMTLSQLEAAETASRAANYLFPDLFDGFGPQPDADLQRVFLAHVDMPEELSLFDLVENGRVANAEAIDGVTWMKDELLQSLAEEINEPRLHLAALFEANPYLSRLYGTMSPDEMTVDPMFTFNADLETVDNNRRATRYVSCVFGSPDFDNAVIETPSGLRFRPGARGDDGLITRQAGETVRGVDVTGAMVIEQHLGAGQPELVEDRRAVIIADNLVNAGGGGGCSCDVSAAEPVGIGTLIFGLALLGFRRRIR